MAYPRDDFTSHRENRDLMHVSSEDLFGDPLHVRDKQRSAALDAGGITEPGPLRASKGTRDPLAYGAARTEDLGFDTRVFDRSRGARGYRPELDQEYPSQEYRNGHSYGNGKEESLWGNATVEWEDAMQETFGYVVSSMWSIVAGGRQCCSMRDRGRKEDLEAAKRAALTGRPPKREELQARPETPQAAREMREHHRHREPFAHDFDEVEEEPPYLHHEADDSLNAAQSLGPVPNSSLPADGFRDDPFLTGRKLPETGFGRAPALAPPMSSRLGREEREEREEMQGDPKPPEPAAPSKWEWPPWCLNFKSPNIEVWVLDEDAGIGRWVSAQPQSRVVDKSGRDAYLCAEYLWDDEYYVQDFGPQHVRRKGETKTVLQTLTQDDPELEATKVFKKNGDESLMDTKVFKDKKGKKEGGLSAILHED